MEFFESNIIYFFLDLNRLIEEHFKDANLNVANMAKLKIILDLVAILRERWMAKL